jgi:hypothetical protein
LTPSIVFGVFSIAAKEYSVNIPKWLLKTVKKPKSQSFCRPEALMKKPRVQNTGAFLNPESLGYTTLWCEPLLAVDGRFHRDA